MHQRQSRCVAPQSEHQPIEYLPHVPAMLFLRKFVQLNGVIFGASSTGVLGSDILLPRRAMLERSPPNNSSTIIYGKQRSTGI